MITIDRHAWRSEIAGYLADDLRRESSRISISFQNAIPLAEYDGSFSARLPFFLFDLRNDRIPRRMIEVGSLVNFIENYWNTRSISGYKSIEILACQEAFFSKKTDDILNCKEIRSVIYCQFYCIRVFSNDAMASCRF